LVLLFKGPAFAPIGIPGDLYLEGTNEVDISVQLGSVNIASYQHLSKNGRLMFY